MQVAIQKDLGGERIDPLACRRVRPKTGQENRPLSDGRFSVFRLKKPLRHEGFEQDAVDPR
jgi:hypothetical protein